MRRSRVVFWVSAVTVGLLMIGGCGRGHSNDMQDLLVSSVNESILCDQTFQNQSDEEKQQETSGTVKNEAVEEVKRESSATIEEEMPAVTKEEFTVQTKTESAAVVKEESGTITSSHASVEMVSGEVQAESVPIQEEKSTTKKDEVLQTTEQEETHHFVVDRVEATCTSDGYEKRYCSLCQEVASETILPMTGHVIVENWWWQPTCTANGYKNSLCSVCGYVDKEKSGTVERLPHTIVEVMVQQGNCMSDTIIQHKCTMCQEIIEEDRYTEYNKHCWSSNEEGTYCDWCGISK